MRIDTERARTYAAPRDRFWPLATEIRRYLETIPEIHSYDVEPSGRRATFDGRLKVGPVAWKVAGSAWIEVVEEGGEVSVGLTIPKLVLDYAGRLRAPRAGGGTTRVRYRGVIDCEHRLAGRLYFLLRQILVDHFALFLDEVLARAEVSYGAQQAIDSRARRAGEDAR